MENLFTFRAWEPLHSLLRPTKKEDIIGQKHLMGPTMPIGSIIENKTPTSFILQGPPGSGKTSIARVVAKSLGLPTYALNATSDGIPALRKIIEMAKENKENGLSPSILFIDEIARWSQTQQDALLPDLESGLFMLIGCTTKNVRFNMDSALLSRVEVYETHHLTDEDLSEIINRAEKSENIRPIANEETKNFLIKRSHGDARTLITILSASLRMNKKTEISLETAKTAAKSLPSAMTTDRHYVLLSALQKSIRASDPQATALYVAMIIEEGEPEETIFRRLLTIASEDVGLADSNGILVVQACYEAFKRSGPPEGRIPLMHAAIYLATAPKSNSAYMALKRATEWVKNNPLTPPPNKIINATTKEMTLKGYGKDYTYDHDCPQSLSYQDCLPEVISRTKDGEIYPFYIPKENGNEPFDLVSKIESKRRLIGSDKKEVS